MACEYKIIKNIISTCETTVANGMEATVYLLNRKEISQVSYDNVNPLTVTDLTLASGATAYTLVGTKKGLNFGSERVIADDAPDSFTHKLTFQGYEIDSASVYNMDNLGDLVAIVERKEKNVAMSGDGTFVILGLESGLYPTSDTYMLNDGPRKIELANLAGESEKTSPLILLDTDYATTKALVESLVV
jgi:hypothetical protein